MRSERGRVVLGDAHVDVEVFAAAGREGLRLQDVGRLQEASALFRGELLADDRYAEWAAGARDDMCMAGRVGAALPGAIEGGGRHARQSRHRRTTRCCAWSPRRRRGTVG